MTPRSKPLTDTDKANLRVLYEGPEDWPTIHAWLADRGYGHTRNTLHGIAHNNGWVRHGAGARKPRSRDLTEKDKADLGALYEAPVGWLVIERWLAARGYSHTRRTVRDIAHNNGWIWCYPPKGSPTTRERTWEPVFYDLDQKEGRRGTT